MQVQITFRERPIYQAPLDVLGHLYYYTTQYGLSVKQFTGEHWRYWEKLPKRLRQAQDSPEELEAIIVELERLAAGSGDRRRKRQAQIQGRWAQKEIILNAQFMSVLAAMPDELLALGCQSLTGSKDLAGEYRIVQLEMQGPEGEWVDFLEPDLEAQSQPLLGHGALEPELHLALAHVEVAAELEAGLLADVQVRREPLGGREGQGVGVLRSTVGMVLGEEDRGGLAELAGLFFVCGRAGQDRLRRDREQHCNEDRASAAHSRRS